ncbi:MAG TPA: zinc-ribbon domain-containing protein [Blastocatellia bacterium]|nr:zinc-ribbon domain-containing protein [Blastocatellia bacterium]
MGYKEIGEQISEALRLIADLPNLRNDPEDPTGTVRLFDGGRVLLQTGATRYEFDGGVTASVSTMPGSALVINFPNGWEVSVRLPRRFCVSCGQNLRAAAKFCPNCGERVTRVNRCNAGDVITSDY